MFYRYLFWKIFSSNCFRKKLQRVVGFASALDHAVDAEFVVHVGLDYLPAARAPDDNLKVFAMRIRLDLCKKLA